MRQFISKLATFIATGFGLGLLPVAPGTWGSLGALPLAYLFGLFGNHYISIGLYLLYAALSVLAAYYYGKQVGDSDHKSIVCDEIVGLMPVLMFFHMAYAPSAFVLFRVFDIWKPGLIGWVDRNVKGVIGCMLDDLIAGAYTFVILFGVWLVLLPDGLFS